MSIDVNQYRRDNDQKQFAKWLERLENEIEKIKANQNAPPPSVVNVSALPGTKHIDTTGKTVDDHHNKDHTAEHNTDGDDPLNVDGLQFELNPSITPQEALAHWNINDHTLNLPTDTDTIIQVGQEVVVRIINKTGAQLDNGTVVYIDGADVTADRPTATKADASIWEDSQMTIGVMTSDVADDAEGFVTVLGYVRDVNTAGMTAGDRIYLSETTGAYTTTRPISPAYIIDLGVVVKVNATTGIIFVNVINRDDFGFQNKSFIEEFDLTVAESGGSVIASLQKTGGGNLTMRFSTGPFTTLVTPPMTKTLTPGTATVPKSNFLYILESDQTQITLSNSDYPGDDIEHIRIAEVILLTAAITALDDPLANQNVNDHAFEHMSHVTEWIRAQRATYKSPGIDGNSSTGHDYFEIETVPDKVYFRSTAGTIRQMHIQSYPVKDTGSIDGGGSDIMYVVNDPDAAYTRITDLIAGITKISDGTAWGNNKYIGLVFFGVISKSGEGQQLMCLLPLGQYNSQLGAENDTNGYTNVSIPDIYSGTGFLICKIVAQKVGTTIAYKSTLDLRGTFPSLLTGAGGGAAIVSFPDNTHSIFNAADPTKRILHDASAIATGTDRTITMPDKDITLAIDTAAEAVNAMGAKADGNPLNHDQGGGAGADTDAIHDNVAGEIDAITYVSALDKTADKFIFEDGSDSLNKKHTQLDDMFNIMDHGDIGGTVGVNDHHNKSHVHIGDGSGDVDHTSIKNPNASADVQHLTAAQVAALHAIFVPGTDNKAFAHMISLQNGASLTLISSPDIYKGSGVFYPASDPDARVQWQFQIPDNATGSYVLHLTFSSDASSAVTYSGKWDISAWAPGETPSSDNVLNNNSANDFVTSTTPFHLEAKTIALSNVAAGDVVAVRFSSDASVGNWILIQAIWIEWS